MDLGTVEALIVARDRSDLAGFGPGDAYLAGGSWIFSEPQVGTRRLIDLTGLGWPSIAPGPQGSLELAATCTMAELASLHIPPSWPALGIARACCDALRGSFKVWNVATVGGNLCCALPAAPMVALTAGLDGVCTLWAPDGSAREVAVVDLILGDQQTALAPGEVIRSIRLPAQALAARAAMRQRSLTPLGRSAALLVGRVDPDGSFVLTITASTPAPVQLRFPSLPTAEVLAEAIEARLPAGSYFDDVHGSPAWRRQLTFVLAQEVRAELAA